MDKEQIKQMNPQEKIKFLSDIMTLARKGDPTAQSLLKELLKIDVIQQKTNFPTPLNQQKQTFLLMCSRFFGDTFGKPFQDMADIDALTWQSFRGFNYLGAVDMVKQGTDLSGLILNPNVSPPAQPQPTKPHFWNKNKNQGDQLEG